MTGTQRRAEIRAIADRLDLAPLTAPKTQDPAHRRTAAPPHRRTAAPPHRPRA